MEAKILFDSDKLDVSGALGIARSLIYQGQVGEPLYVTDEENNLCKGQNSNDPESFLKEYYFKLAPLYEKFYTKEAYQIAQARKGITTAFYDELLDEIAMDDLQKLLDLK